MASLAAQTILETADGTSLRATKSSQFLNFALARASIMAFDWTGLIFGSFPSSAAVAVLRLILLATGAVAAPVVSGLGAAAAGGVGDGAGLVA